MFLSRVQLNRRRDKTKELLDNPRAMHAMVESAFPGEQNRNLWRVDRLGEKDFLLLASPDRPDLTHLVESAGYESEPAKVCDYAPIFEALQEGTVVGFRLCANPTRRLIHDPYAGDGKGLRGKRVSLTRDGDRVNWMVRKANDIGLDLDHMRIAEAQQVTLPRGRSTVSLQKVVFEGVGTVAKPGVLRAALCSGVGPNKAYGCGMMTVIPQG